MQTRHYFAAIALGSLFSACVVNRNGDGDTEGGGGSGPAVTTTAVGGNTTVTTTTAGGAGGASTTGASGGGGGTPDWVLPAWGNRVPITFDATNLTNTVALNGFVAPLPVALTGAAASGMKPNGEDLVLVDKATGMVVPIDFESEQGGAIWIRTNVAATPAALNFDLYYGNPACTQLGCGMFVPADVYKGGNFAGIWHLNEPTAPAAPVPHTNAIDPAGPKSAPGDNALENATDGIAGYQGFGGGVRLALAGITSLMPLESSSFTVTFRFRSLPQTTSVDRVLFSAQSNAVEFSKTLVLAKTTGNLRFEQGALGTTNASVNAADGDWKHVAVVTRGAVDDDAIEIYMNGILALAMPDTIAAGADSGEVQVSGSLGTAQGFLGYIDEFRIAKVARSPDWIAAEEHTTRQPGFFWSAGAAESP